MNDNLSNFNDEIGMNNFYLLYSINERNTLQKQHGFLKDILPKTIIKKLTMYSASCMTVPAPDPNFKYFELISVVESSYI